MDVDARIQLFDFKTKYQFMTSPGITDYNMPLYDIQYEGSNPTTAISFYPVYQGFEGPCFINGIQVPFYSDRSSFYNLWPNYAQAIVPVISGDGTAGPYIFELPFFPAIPGHVDVSGIVATGTNQDPPTGTTINTSIPQSSIYSTVYITTTNGANETVVIAGSGQFLSTNVNYELLYQPGTNPFGYSALPGGYSTTSNTVNYQTGQVTVTFPMAIPSGNEINVQCYFYEQGLPRSLLYYNNCMTVRPPPNIPYLVELTAYLSPSAFLNSSASVPFAYMAEYIARGAARKILSDTGDIEQFSFYEPLFREQESLVWKRSQRQFTSTRTETLFSQGALTAGNNYNQGMT